MNNAPIGIFDSGVGGLTVARAVLDQLPQEELVYIGDTAHTPYVSVLHCGPHYNSLTRYDTVSVLRTPGCSPCNIPSL